MNTKITALNLFSRLAQTCVFLVGLASASSSAVADMVTADINFRPPTFAKAIPPQRALLLPDGKYFLFYDPDTLTDQTSGPLTRYLADGTLDGSFNFSRDYKTVTAVARGENGQLYVAATRYAYGIKDAEQILRLNDDGTIDSTFGPTTVGGTHSFTDVRRIIVQADGNVLVAGTFLSFGGDASRRGVVRLLTTGTLDTKFAAVSLNGDVYGLALQDDGKVLISGTFTTVNAVANLTIARLNSDGTLDSAFQASGFSRGSTGPTRDLKVQPDGAILIAGHFRIGTGTFAQRMPVIRLNTTGACDTTFNSSGFNNPGSIPTVITARELALQADGKVIVAVNNSVYRLNTDGSKDTGFRQPVFMDATLTPSTSLGIPATVDVDVDGHVVVGGVFTDVDPSGTPTYAHFGVVRLGPDGNVDSTLVSSHHTGNEIVPTSFVRLDDGSTLVAFADKIDPPVSYNLGRLLSDGSLDPNFTLSSSDPNRFLNGFNAHGIERLPDGNFFVYGVDAYGVPVYGKVNSNGAEDVSFATNHGVVVQQATVASDGKIFVAAGTDVQLTVYAPFGRLKADGQVDTFSGGNSIYSSQVFRNGFNNMIGEVYVGNRVLAIQPDGKVLFQYFAQDKLFHFVRLNMDGSFDSTFAETTFAPTDITERFPLIVDPQFGPPAYQPPNGVWSATPSLQDAYIQSDGRIIVTGHFTTFGNANARGIVRLQPDGTIDNTFNIGGGPQWTSTTETASFYPAVENIEPQADGKFLVTGTFEAFDGTAAPGIAQLNADGSVDTSFVAPVHRDKRSRVESAFRAQPDSSFLLNGPYVIGNETTTRSLIRLVNAQPGAVNISTRLGVGTDENVLIEGFIVQGPAGSSKKIMVRAIGPSLTQFGIADALENPTLEIHDANSNIVATNNDWKTTQTGGLITGDQFAEINASGLAPGNELESALIVALEPGSYTAVVRGAGNTVGTGVVDAFDLDAGSSARLANIATRGLVQPGDKLMIAGFIVQNGAVKVVVRAIGPSLIDFGISNALPDTTLQLRDQQGAVVMENDDWKLGQPQELESLALQPSHDLEAALVATIPPGQYTAQVRGKGDASGIGVVQVYFLQ